MPFNPAQLFLKHVQMLRAFGFREGAIFNRFAMRLAWNPVAQVVALVFAYSLSMAPYGASFPGTPKVLDLVEVSSLRWREYGQMRGFLTSAEISSNPISPGGELSRRSTLSRSIS